MSIIYVPICVRMTRETVLKTDPRLVRKSIDFIASPVNFAINFFFNKETIHIEVYFFVYSFISEQNYNLLNIYILVILTFLTSLRLPLNREINVMK